MSKSANQMKGFTNKVNRSIRKAAVKALNQALKHGRIEIRDFIASNTGLKKGYLNKRLWANKARVNRLRAELRGASKGTPFAVMSPKRVKVQSRRGIRYGVTAKVQGGRQLLPGGFMATMKSGKTGVWRRRGQERLPIGNYKSSVIADMFDRSDTKQLFERVGKREFEKTFAQEMRTSMSKMSGAA